MMRAKSDIELSNRVIAGLLWYGTWLASAIIALGTGLEVLNQIGCDMPFVQSGLSLMKTGVIIFILLPVARVILMLGLFLRNRDYLYTVLSAFVLVVIGIGVLVGLSIRR